jgi:hypothetical protein
MGRGSVAVDASGGCECFQDEEGERALEDVVLLHVFQVLA